MNALPILYYLGEPTLAEELKLAADAVDYPALWALVQEYAARPVKGLAQYDLDAELLRRRYDDQGRRQATLEQLGAQYGLTRQRVYERLWRIKCWLRHPAQQQRYRRDSLRRQR